MYEPPHFVENRQEVLAALIERHPLGMLVTVEGDVPVANPLPFLLDWPAGCPGRLLAHMARSNTQWQGLARGGRALVIFQGEQAYVSPSWYPTKAETGKVVPTWNYCMVQVRGRVTLHHDEAWLQRQIGALTDRHEQGRNLPWAVGDAPARFLEMQMRAIVGLEIEIDEIHGKWKASQNRPLPDRLGVVGGLAAENEAMAGTVASYLPAAEG